ncbi:methyltransferase-like protein 27 [Centroberyx gerrardi]|uniref:methyltransferase-like protein 27 n=1 Tax=Centroberyx gerrardi TaxID=166262 RepID=UPI003AAF2BB9
MSDFSKSFEDVRTFLRDYKNTDPEKQVQCYDVWAEKYEKDVPLLGYNAPTLAVNCLLSNFPESREAALVLDVACGTGLVAKLMSELGFRHFVGVDGSKGMLEQAAKTGLYQDLRLALLGTQPLPAQADMFDVVMMVGALGVGFVPVSVARELCHATKPGGFVCITRGGHRVESTYRLKADLEKEFQLMEEEGLWTCVEAKEKDKYMRNVHSNNKRDVQEEEYISGSVYLYRKSLK